MRTCYILGCKRPANYLVWDDEMQMELESCAAHAGYEEEDD